MLKSFRMWSQDKDKLPNPVTVYGKKVNHDSDVRHLLDKHRQGGPELTDPLFAPGGRNIYAYLLDLLSDRDKTKFWAAYQTDPVAQWAIEPLLLRKDVTFDELRRVIEKLVEMKILKVKVLWSDIKHNVATTLDEI